MGKKLKSLEEHNNQAGIGFAQSRNPLANGIACPKCGKELYDTNPSVSLLTYPMQKRVECMPLNGGCGFSGTRMAQ